MAKIKYIFNHKTLSYEKVHNRFRDKLRKVLSYVLTSVFFSFIVLVIGFSVIDSPKEKKLKREIAQLNLQYELLGNRMSEVNQVMQDMASRDNNIYRIVLDADPIPSEVRTAGYGGADRYKDLQGFSSSDLMTETTRKMDQLVRQIYVQSRSYDEIEKLAKNKEQMLACMPAIQPIDNKQLKGMLSGFGMRIHPIYKTLRMHTGIDFAAPLGTPVYATGDGVVETADDLDRGYGNHVVINHGFGYESLYGHLSRMAAKVGEKVKRGQIIGYVGSTGESTGDHLHYEVIKNGVKVNPISYFFNDLSPDEFKQIRSLASQPTQSLD
ncbi:MAG TPA: M23 family metallopeptidase [Bacteroidia bacterium]|jgi:murein DD-endopeptidase MepM/ murein hydrolase activator NlpD|nr:M23 family metallopeptidase [Bacteroidia bacterium]